MNSKKGILEALERAVVVADGGMGTQLQMSGLEPGDSCEAWNIEHPETVAAIHEAYVQAGAQILTTNTFRGNRYALRQYGLEDRVEELNRAAVTLAKKAASDACWVMGSMGPLGGFLEPLGDITAQEAFEYFFEQANVLVLSGVDAIVLETFTAVEEMEIALRAVRAAGAEAIFASMAFDKARDGFRTMMGVAVASAVRSMKGADVIGCNCGSGLAIEDHAAIVRSFRAASGQPLIVQPNAGQPEILGESIAYSQEPVVFEKLVSDLVSAGANIIGGCCGTTPDHIRAIKSGLSGLHCGFVRRNA